MPQIIQILSLNMDTSMQEARRLELIIAQERVEAFVVPGVAVYDVLLSMGVTRLPVFQISGVTVWEGEKPSEQVVREWLHWPKTLDEAVTRVLASVPTVPEDLLARHQLGMAIRNSFGLWGANQELLHSCGSETMRADDASEVILREAQDAQRERNNSARHAVSLKPDYGLHMLDQAYHKGQFFYFYSVPVDHLSLIDYETFSITINHMVDGKEFAVSFDLPNRLFENLLKNTPPHIVDAVIAGLKSVNSLPYTIELPADFSINIEAKLGELQQSAHEPFVPFIVQRVF